MSKGFLFVVVTLDVDYEQQRVDIEDWSEAGRWAEHLASTGQHFEDSEAGLTFVPSQAVKCVKYREIEEAS